MTSDLRVSAATQSSPLVEFFVILCFRLEESEIQSHNMYVYGQAATGGRVRIKLVVCLLLLVSIHHGNGAIIRVLFLGM